MKEISVKNLKINPITLIPDDWMLLTAGTKETGYNAMTCSWGHMGAVWGRGRGLPTAICYVRPQQYTKEFLDRENLYTLSFFNGYMQELAYLGTHSGRYLDKIKQARLTPVFDDGFTYFEEADLVLVCRKIYRAPISEEGFINQQTVEDNYPDRIFHEMYVGEIVKVLISDRKGGKAWKYWA